MDDVLEDVRTRAGADAATVGVLLIGSRSVGAERSDSDHDLVWVLADEALAARREERHVKAEGLDILYTSVSRLAKNAAEPGWYTGALLGGRIVTDSNGQLAAVLARAKETAAEHVRARVDEYYDSYLNSFVRSMKAWKRRDDLGGRLHAAESVVWLVRTLCGLVGRWPPYHDELAAALPELEQEAGLPLADDLRRIVETGDPVRQQQLEQRVETLMSSRGFPHQWGDDLEPLKSWRFG